MSIALLALLSEETAAARRHARPLRPFWALDLLLALVLLGMACASICWHGSNCTGVHMLDSARALALALTRTLALPISCIPVSPPYLQSG